VLNESNCVVEDFQRKSMSDTVNEASVKHSLNLARTFAQVRCRLCGGKGIIRGNNHVASPLLMSLGWTWVKEARDQNGMSKNQK
jgi:cytochrome c-type biogenesis protein CcmH/NrfF